MSIFYPPIASWACFSTLFLAAWSTPELAFPVNSQVPPVAYASQPFEFAFSLSTFRSDLPVVSYALTDAPKWLSLNSDRRLFEGSPKLSDVGASTFQLRASDGEGEASSDVTLIVIESPNVRVENPILPSLAAAGYVSAPSTLLLKPLAPFSIAFTSDVFAGASATTKYYAISENSSPLPPWIQFDETQLKFSGTSPPLVSPSADQQFYGISLIASDVPGFAEAIASFQIAIAYQTLAFTETTSSLDISPGHAFQSPPFRQSLKLDDGTIQPGELASVTADLPEWVHLDSEEIALSGTVPKDFEQTRLVISARDSHGNTANLTVQLKANTTNTTVSGQSLNTTALIGENFSYTIDKHIVGDYVEVSADLTDAPKWLSFSAKNLTLQGHIPADVQPSDVTVDVVVAADDLETSIQLSIHVVRAQIKSSTSSQTFDSTITSSPLPAPTGQIRDDSDPGEGRTKPKHLIAIVLTTVLVSLFVLLCICFLVFWLRRRAKSERTDEKQKAPTQPTAEAQDVEMPNRANLPPIAESSRKLSISRVTPRQAPQVDLPWAPDSLQQAKKRLSKRLPSKKQGSFDSSWSGLVTRPDARSGVSQSTDGPFEWHPTVRTEPPPVTFDSAKRQSTAAKARASRQTNEGQQRRSRALSTATKRQVGLPKRVSGAGHGAGGLTTNKTPQRSSWQTTLGSIPLVDSRPSTTALESFPAPPSEGKEYKAPESLVNRTKPSLRLVDPSSDRSDSFEIKRQKWHTERARDRLEGVARFSNASSSQSVSLPKILGASAFSPNRTISSTIPENGTYGSRTRDPSWSKWSGVGPAARAESPISAKVPAPLFTRATHRLAREVSIASSGQFDSALSSESQWEDENLIAEVNDAGQRQWHTDTDSAAHSPRLPFEPFSSSQEEVGNAEQVGLSRGARLIDKRKHVSVEDGEINRSEKSQVGSFRFI